MELIRFYVCSDYADRALGLCYVIPEVKTTEEAARCGFRLGLSLNPRSARVRRALRRRFFDSSFAFSIYLAEKYAIKVCARYNRIFGGDQKTSGYLGLNVAYWSVA